MNIRSQETFLNSIARSSNCPLDMADYQPFNFGFELELSLNSKKKHKSWLLMAHDTGGRLAKKGVSNHVKEKVDGNYRKWSIVQEITIPQDPAKNNCEYSNSRHDNFGVNA